MENAAITVVFRCQRPDGEYQARMGGGSCLGVASTPFTGPLGVGCSEVVDIGDAFGRWPAGRPGAGGCLTLPGGALGGTSLGSSTDSSWLGGPSLATSLSRKACVGGGMPGGPAVRVRGVV